MTPMASQEPRIQTPAGARTIAAVNGVLAALSILVGLVVTFVALDHTVRGLVADPLTGFQIPVVVGGSLIVLGATLFLVSRDLWDGLEDGRQATMGWAVVVLATFYLHLHLASVLVTGTAFDNAVLVVAGGLAVALIYSVPILFYLTRPAVLEVTAPAKADQAAAEPDPAAEPAPGEVLDTEPVEGGRSLEPDFTVGQPLTGDRPPAGAVAKTTCSTCETPLAVTTVERPVVVQCPECGTHGQLSRRPGEWPAYR